MKTALVLAALALLVIVPLAAQPAAAHHGGWSCATASSAAEVCVARSLQWPSDCVTRGHVLGIPLLTMCY